MTETNPKTLSKLAAFLDEERSSAQSKPTTQTALCPNCGKAPGHERLGGFCGDCYHQAVVARRQRTNGTKANGISNPKPDLSNNPKLHGSGDLDQRGRRLPKKPAKAVLTNDQLIAGSFASGAPDAVPQSRVPQKIEER
jgi:hypothetical protein